MSGVLRQCTRELKRLVERGELNEIQFLREENIRGTKTLIDRICEGASRGGDIEALGGLEKWIENLKFSSVLLTQNDYLVAAVHALRFAPRFAATDYGTTRQRDLAQLWSDTIRGLLGEVAFAKWMKLRFGVDVEPDFRKDALRENLASDILRIRRPGEDTPRAPRLGISIKTTKLQGMWLDIPFNQLEYSSVFVLVRIGITRDHLLAFLKHISVIRDKIFAMAKSANISFDETEIWEALPDFRDIPAFIAGYFNKHEYGGQAVIEADGDLKKRRRGGWRLVLKKFAGVWDPSDRRLMEEVVTKIRQKKSAEVGGVEEVEIELEGLKKPSGGRHFFVSSGLLKKREEDWARLVESL